MATKIEILEALLYYQRPLREIALKIGMDQDKFVEFVKANGLDKCSESELKLHLKAAKSAPPTPSPNTDLKIKYRKMQTKLENSKDPAIILAQLKLGGFTYTLNESGFTDKAALRKFCKKHKIDWRKYAP